MSFAFDYETAFSRNIGWVTETEQLILRTKRIAIAGMGGVGGSHLLTLTRLGIGAFNISDFDNFELVNFNRQAGASMSHAGRPKVEVLSELALDINPDLEIRRFPGGIDQHNVRDFLAGVDLYVDGLDFFAVEARRQVFAACAEMSIPAVTAAPLGMGVALLNFLPGKMTFEEYFCLEGQSKNEQLLRFLLGLSPAMLQMPYLVDDTRVDLVNHRGPSTPMACELCAGMAATHALKILLKRGKVPAAPRGVHFDAYRNRRACTWRPAGNNNPIQKLGLKIARNRLGGTLNKAMSSQRESASAPRSPIDKILDLARWAPSGDNTQPWRFEILGADHLRIHGSDTRDWCVYDLEGRASQLAIGALLETIAIAATGQGMTAAFALETNTPETNPVIDVRFGENPAQSQVRDHPLLPYIKRRVTQRRPFSTRPLDKGQRNALAAAVGDGYRVVWVDTLARKRRLAHLLFRSAHIRLTIREAFEVHRRVIDWGKRFSEDRIPDEAVGLDPVTLKLMQWAMRSWDRVSYLNRFFLGTFMPRLTLDYVPGVKCAAHFLIVADQQMRTLPDYLAGGRCVQRFWLTATSLGLQFQPEMTPLIFSHYAMRGIAFSKQERAARTAARVRRDLEALVGVESVANGVYMGRLGYGSSPRSRSTRLPLAKLELVPGSRSAKQG